MTTIFAFLFLAAVVTMTGFLLKAVKLMKVGKDPFSSIKLALLSLGGTVVFLVLIGVTASAPTSNEQTYAAENHTDAKIETADQEESKPDETTATEAKDTKNDDKSKLREAFNASLGDTAPTWYESVRNDVTGNWRELVVYSSKSMDKDLAIAYANA